MLYCKNCLTFRKCKLLNTFLFQTNPEIFIFMLLIKLLTLTVIGAESNTVKGTEF